MSESKERIVTATLKLFLQKSFKEVTMKEIVEQTGLSKGAFYHYFSSKEQVFEEVMNHFFSSLLTTDWSHYSQDSLHDFYNDHLANMIQKYQLVKRMGAHDQDVFTANHYFLLFDAMNLLPGFRKKYLDQHEKELKVWTKVISQAQKSGELRPEIASSKIAKLFIYSGDGTGIHSILAADTDKGVKEIKLLWDTLYDTLKN